MNRLKKIIAGLASLSFVFALFTGIRVKTVAATDALTNGTYDSENTKITWTSENLAIVQEKGTATSNYWPKEEQVETPHGYKNNTLTFTPLNNTVLTSLIITCPKTSDATGIKNSTWDKGTVTSSSNVITWNGYVYDSSLVLTFGGSYDFTTITYEAESLQNTFAATDLKESLLYSYSYTENEKSVVSEAKAGRPYYLGTVITTDKTSTEYFATKATTAQIAAASTGYSEVTTEASGSSKYFYLKIGTMYIAYSGTSTSLTNSTTKTETDYGLWYINSNNLICNKSTESADQQRCLAYTNNSTYLTVNCQLTTKAGKAYSTNPAAYLYTTNGDVTYSNVSMRIGFEVPSDLKAIYETLGYEIGVMVNGSYEIPCTSPKYDETTGTYMYYAQVTDIPSGNYGTVIQATGYIKKDGVTTVTTEVNGYSVKSLAEVYITDSTLSATEAVKNHLYTLTYLAYCA